MAARFRSSEELFRLLVESVTDYAIFVLDPDGYVASWNAGAQRIKGWTADEIIGRHFSAFYPPEDVAIGKLERELEGAAKDGRFEDEGWRVRKDGSRFWANVVITALRDPDGELVGFAKVTRDLTERKDAEENRLARARAEESARANEEAREQITTTLRSIGDAVIAADAEGKVTMMNPPAEGLTGWTENGALGHRLDEVFRIIDSETRAKVESPVEKVLRTGTIVGLANHTLLVTKAGDEIPIDDSGAPIRRSDGRIVGVVLVFRSASAENEAAMRRSFLADFTTALHSTLDQAQTLQKIAELAVPRLADWCVVDLVDGSGATPTRIAVAHSDPTKVELASRWALDHAVDSEPPRIAARVVKSGRSEIIPAISDEMLDQLARTDDERAVLEQLAPRSAISVPIRARDQVIGAMSLVMAESKRRFDQDDLEFAEDLARRAGLAVENARLFAEAETAKQEADAANRAKDLFLATVSHELRAPLNAISGWANLMAGRMNDANLQVRAVDTIVRNSRTMARLIEDLLDVSRIVSGQMRLEMAPIELVPVVEAAIDVVRPAADAKKIRIESSLDTGGRRIVGDAARLQQVVWNLLTNAVKFTPEGGSVRVSARASGTGVELAVSDTGRGIEPSFLPFMFEPFRQAHAGVTRPAGGLGLGMAITRHLVEAHGGTIRVSSAGRDRGATFVVHLPESGPPANDRPAAPRAEPPRPEAPGLSGRHVLVVDDEPDSVQLLATALEQCGARVTTATSMDSALRAIGEDPPDVLLSDIGMPEGDGYELVRRVRALPADRGGNVPAAAITGYARPEDRRRALQAGFMAHVAKPVEPSELCAVVEGLARFAPRPAPS